MQLPALLVKTNNTVDSGSVDFRFSGSGDKVEGGGRGGEVLDLKNITFTFQFSLLKHDKLISIAHTQCCV